MLEPLDAGTRGAEYLVAEDASTFVIRKRPNTEIASERAAESEIFENMDDHPSVDSGDFDDIRIPRVTDAQAGHSGAKRAQRYTYNEMVDIQEPEKFRLDAILGAREQVRRSTDPLSWNKNVTGEIGDLLLLVGEYEQERTSDLRGLRASFGTKMPR